MRVDTEMRTHFGDVNAVNVDFGLALSSERQYLRCLWMSMSLIKITGLENNILFSAAYSCVHACCTVLWWGLWRIGV